MGFASFEEGFTAPLLGGPPPDQLSDDLTYLARRFTGLQESPGLLYAAATSATPERTAEEISGLREAIITRRRIEKYPEAVQMSLYGEMGDGERDNLDAVGYVVPHRKPENRWWVKFVGRPIGFVLSETVGNVFEFAGKAAEGIDHWYRAMTLLEREESLRETGDPWRSQGGLSIFRNAVPAGADFARAWRETAEGEAHIPFADEAFDRYDLAVPERLRGAMIDAARGLSEDEITLLWGDRGAEAIAHPSYRRAVATLEDLKLSFGRGIAGTQLGLKPGSGAFEWVSGSADAAQAWFGDPANVLLGATSAVRAARKVGYVIQRGADDVYRLDQASAGVRIKNDRLWEILDTAERAEDGKILAADRIRSEFPELGAWVQPLIDDAPKTRTEMVDFFARQADELATVNGDAATRYTTEITRTRLQALWGQAKASDPVKDVAAALWKFGPTRPLARAVRGIGTSIDDQDSFDPLGESAIEHIRATARLVHEPREARRIVDTFIAADIEGKRRIWLSTLDQVDEMTGRNPDMKEMFDQLGSRLTEGRSRSFLTGRDAQDLGVTTTDDGKRTVHGLRESQILGRTWTAPNYNEILRMSSAAYRIRKAVGLGVVPTEWIGRASDLWRAGKVLTLIQGLRQGAEEVGGWILAHGFAPVFKARMGVSAAKRLAALDEATQASTKVRFHHVKQGLARAQQRLSDTEILDSIEAVQRILPDGVVLPPLIDPAGAEILDDIPTLSQQLRKGGTPVTTKFQPGAWRMVGGTEDGAVYSLQDELSRAINDESFRITLQMADHEDTAATIAEYLASEAAESVRKASTFFKTMSEQIGEQAAIARWADELAEGNRALISNADGVVNDDLVAALREGKAPAIEDLHRIAAEGRMPRAFSSREFTSIDERGSLVNWLQTNGFRVVDKQMGWVARQPMFYAEVTAARKQLRAHHDWLIEKGIGADEAQRMVDARAIDLAARRVYEQIDDPRLKSFFARQHHAMFPFWNAFQQFTVRWGRRMARNPESARRAQLVMQGIEGAGFIEEDENGERRFHYPAIGFAFDVLARSIPVLSGADALSGMPVSFTGNLKYVLPGTADPLRPGLGPILTIPYERMRQHLPEFAREAFEGVGGEVGSTRPLWEQIAPTAAVALLKPWVVDQDDAYLMSTVNAAIAYAEANDQGLPENADPIQQEEYIAKIRTHARLLLTLRGIFSMSAPGGPRAQAMDSLVPEVRKMISQHGIDEGIRLFLKAHPDADPYTVFSSEVVEGAVRPLPATEEAGRFVAQHEALLDEYGPAVTWLMPEAPDGFDPGVWREQLAKGLRSRRTGVDFWKEQKIVAARRTYYDQKERYAERAERAVGMQRNEIDAEWQEWSGNFLAAHPIFREDHQGGAARKGNRQETVGRLWLALQDDRAPDVPHAGELRNLLSAYMSWARADEALQGQRSRYALHRRRQMAAQMHQIGAGLTSEAARSFFTSNIQPDLPEEVR